MPIGTSDGQHFDDAFQQGVEMLKQKMSRLPLNEDVPPQSVEDRRSEDPLSQHMYAPSDAQRDKLDTDYLSQDLSKYEKNPLSKEAGISSIPNTNPYKIKDLTSIIDWASTSPKIDRSHEVPYVAGASSSPLDWTTHVDKSVPRNVTISGKTFDPATPLAIHEQVEREVMEQLIGQGMNKNSAYQVAHHEYAQVAEDNWYRQHGIDVNEMDKFWSKINTKTEKDKGDFPPTLYKKPYPHDQVKGEKHTPSDIFQEWAQTQK